MLLLAIVWLTVHPEQDTEKEELPGAGCRWKCLCVVRPSAAAQNIDVTEQQHADGELAMEQGMAATESGAQNMAAAELAGGELAVGGSPSQPETAASLLDPVRPVAVMPHNYSHTQWVGTPPFCREASAVEAIRQLQC